MVRFELNRAEDVRDELRKNGIRTTKIVPKEKGVCEMFIKVNGEENQYDFGKRVDKIVYDTINGYIFSNYCINKYLGDEISVEIFDEEVYDLDGD